MAETNQKTNTVRDEPEPIHKAKRTRSPAYPSINLETAIKRAGALHDQDKMNAVPLKIAVKRWGFKEKSSGGLVTTAALKSFGLIKDSGSGDDRRIQITEEARRILLDQRQESSERDETIKQAALKPKIHQFLWRKWGADLPPNDTFSHELIFELSFNENSVKDFIKEYRDTISFAKLTNSDTLSSNGEDKNEITDQLLNEDLFNNLFPPPPSKPLQAKPGMNNDTITLKEGQVVLQWPSKMSEESYEDYKEWLDLMARRAKRAVDKKEPGE